MAVVALQGTRRVSPFLPPSHSHVLPPDWWGKKPTEKPQVNRDGIAFMPDGGLLITRTDGSQKIIPAESRRLPEKF